MCDVPSIAVFCSESIECFPGKASKFFLKLLVTIPVAPIITGTIVHIYLFLLLSSSSSLLLLLLLLYDMDVSCQRPFPPGTSLEPAVIPTAQASSFTLQYFPYYV